MEYHAFRDRASIRLRIDCDCPAHFEKAHTGCGCVSVARWKRIGDRRDFVLCRAPGPGAVEQFDGRIGDVGSGGCELGARAKAGEYRLRDCR